MVNPSRRQADGPLRTRPQTGLADVLLDDAQIVITPRGRWKLAGLRRRITIPLDDVATCGTDPTPDRTFTTETRRFGTATAASKAGFFSGPEKRSWWLYRFGRTALVLTLTGNRLDYVVVEVADAAASANTIRARLLARPSR